MWVFNQNQPSVLPEYDPVCVCVCGMGGGGVPIVSREDSFDDTADSAFPGSACHFLRILVCVSSQPRTGLAFCENTHFKTINLEHRSEFGAKGFFMSLCLSLNLEVKLGQGIGRSFQQIAEHSNPACEMGDHP